LNPLFKLNVNLGNLLTRVLGDVASYLERFAVWMDILLGGSGGLMKTWIGLGRPSCRVRKKPVS
jgi:hypothetical protein